MRTAALFFVLCCVALADESTVSPMENVSVSPMDGNLSFSRPTMSEMEPNIDIESDIRNVFVSIVFACSKKDTDLFFSHFTPDRCKSIRKSMVKAIGDGLEMQIVEFQLREVRGDRATANLQYRWEIPGRAAEIVTSTFGLVSKDGAWLVSSESATSSVPVALSLSSDEDASGFKPPLGVKWVPGNCANGRCGVAQ